MKKILIKKYPNRRLYNTQISSYIALNDLFKMVRQGIEFTVVDSKTNEDLTRSILAQIIFEQEAKGYNLLSSNFLRQIICCYQEPNNTILPHYLETMMYNFSTHYDNLHQINATHPLKLFETLNQNNIELIEKSFKVFYKSFNLDKSHE